ncbi:hypothetical protein ACHAO9_009458 [Fusarium lateritium]
MPLSVRLVVCLEIPHAVDASKKAKNAFLLPHEEVVVASKASVSAVQDRTIIQMNRPPDLNTQAAREPDEQSEWLSSQVDSSLDRQSDDEDDGRDVVQLKGHFTSSDLLNPSDALDLLAHVADMDPEGHNQPQEAPDEIENSTRNTNPSQGICHYPPIASGALAASEASFLIEQ